MYVLWCGTVHITIPVSRMSIIIKKGVYDMFVRPEAEVVLFAEELFTDASAVVTTKDPHGGIDLPDLE